MPERNALALIVSHLTFTPRSPSPLLVLYPTFHLPLFLSLSLFHTTTTMQLKHPPNRSPASLLWAYEQRRQSLLLDAPTNHKVFSTITTLDSTIKTAIHAPGSKSFVRYNQMKQNDSTLQQYYNTANEFKANCLAIQPRDEAAFTKAFIYGLSKVVYRRRLARAAKREGYAWAALTTHLNWLVLEDQYIKDQAFALNHRFSDGSVLWSDGSRRYRFVQLPVLTEMDVDSTSDEEEL